MAPTASKAIEAATREAWPRETGGILVGHYVHAYLAQVTLPARPPPRSRQGPAFFHRSTHGLRRLLDAAWTRGQHYVGEWHYHPAAEAVASPTDLASIRKIATTPSYRCPTPILLVAAGIQNRPLSYDVHVVERGHTVKLRHEKTRLVEATR